MCVTYTCPIEIRWMRQPARIPVGMLGLRAACPHDPKACWDLGLELAPIAYA